MSDPLWEVNPTVIGPDETNALEYLLRQKFEHGYELTFEVDFAPWYTKILGRLTIEKSSVAFVVFFVRFWRSSAFTDEKIGTYERWIAQKVDERKL